MKNRPLHMLPLITATVLAAGTANAAQNVQASAECSADHEQEIKALASAILPLMPTEQRRAIIAAGGIGSEAYTPNIDHTGEALVAFDPRYERLRDFVSPALFARMKPEHLDAALNMLDRAENDETPIAMCFAPDTDPDLVMAMNALFENQFWHSNMDDDGNRFQIGARWTTTASDFSTGSQGTPITLTYSFPPDGALADNLSGQNRSNQLNSWMNSLYGSPAVWQGLFQQVFDRWGQLINVTYIHENNDDGVEANTLGGQIGVRGDVRIFAVSLDGNSGVLAYNMFPNQGDMVFDAFDSFFNSFSQNSRRLRNVAAHEHGHGLGFNHVCPANQTKLMEPFVSTLYDGPQLDDILAGQRNYGDPNEINDNAANATDLGNWFVGRSDSVENMSIDDNSDIDFYKIVTTQPLEIDVTVSPDAGIYQQGPQTQSCSSGTTTNYNTKQDLKVSLRDSNGTTTLIQVNDTSAGSAEHLLYTLNAPGTYYIVVDDASNNNSIQRYRMDIAGNSVPFDGPSITAQQTPPTVVLPGTPVSLDYEVLANADTIIDGPDLHYRFDGGSFITVPMSAQGNDIFRATIPAGNCGDNPEYYISVVGAFVGEVDLPAAGASAPFAYQLGSFTPTFEDDFENFTGWNDSISTATSGDWERGVPVASNGAPPSDFDGSGKCYVTGNTAGEDVDFGRVFLSSPGIDMSTGGQFSYAYWLSGGGDNFDGDNMKVEVSFDGQITWTTLRTYTSDTNGWQTDTITIDPADGVANTRFRFVVEDTGANNTVEGAIDAVSVGTVVCTDPGGCNPADIAEPFGVLDLQDINAFIGGFVAQDPIADLNGDGVFDLQDIAAFTSNFTAGCP